MNVDKDPDSVLDYGVTFVDFLAADEDITAFTVTVPAGLTKQSESLLTPIVKVWLTGGTLGEAYLVKVHITTDQGRQDDRTFRVQIRNK